MKKRDSRRKMHGSGLTRRTFLKAAGIGMGTLAAGSTIPGFRHAFAQYPSSLEKFVDSLPIPSVLTPMGEVDGAAYYEVGLSEFLQQLHRDLPPTPVWGYNGTFPGPTIEARRNKMVKVKWMNNLPTEHLLEVDTTIPGAEYPENPLVRNVVHLHGAHVRPEADGYPEDWFIPGEHAVYDYPNSQRATTLWYHDHALGITRLNVYAGLAGFYLIRDPFEMRCNLPRAEYEIPLVIQDRSFNADGSLYYPPQFMPEFFGETAVVNGKVWPYLEVEPRKYRLRLLNGSNGRFYNLKLLDGPPLYQIGSDGGLLSAPVRIDGHLLLAPAERADVIVDFSGYEGASILLHNNAKTPFQRLDQEEDEVPLPEIMLFKVGHSVSVQDTSAIPDRLVSVRRLSEQSALKTRDLMLQMKMEMKPGGGMRMKHLINGKGFHDPVTENPQLGTTEIWRIINGIRDAHPIHVHLVQFQILDRQPFDVARYMSTGEIVYTGERVPPDPNEAGWKDTVRANPGEVTRIIARFGNYAGRYVYHCHILEHEDFDMMRPFDVVAGGLGQTPGGSS